MRLAAGASISCHVYEGKVFPIPFSFLKKPHVATVTDRTFHLPYSTVQHEADTGARSDVSIHTTLGDTFHPREDKALI